MSLSQAANAQTPNADEKMREVVKGIKTKRIVQGEPYELAGKRLVFTNWYYVRIMPPGRKLRINALTHRVGSILVQVDGIAGRSFADATPVIGDQHRTPVTWKGQEDIGCRDGSPLVLRFKMERAKIFGLEFV